MLTQIVFIGNALKEIIKFWKVDTYLYFSKKSKLNVYNQTFTNLKKRDWHDSYKKNLNDAIKFKTPASFSTKMRFIYVYNTLVKG